MPKGKRKQKNHGLVVVFNKDASGTYHTVRLEHDDNPENPCDHDGWKVYSFGRRHSNFKDPEEIGLGELDQYGEPAILKIGLRKKLEVGTAFLLGYFEHGNCSWFLRGNRPPGTEGDFRWDGVDLAGILIWEGKVKHLGPKTYEKRAEDAARFLETYTNWCNGAFYGYMIEDDEEEHIDSCWGFDDADYMLDQVREIIARYPGAEITVVGDASYLAKPEDLMPEDDKQ